MALDKQVLADFLDRSDQTPGERLKRRREELKLTFRDVEQASLSIAQHHENDEFSIALSRLFEIEKKGVVPTLYRLYSLSAIYGLDLFEVMQWYGVDATQLPLDTLRVRDRETGLIPFTPPSQGSVPFPLSLDPGIDLENNALLSRMIQRWGSMPLILLKRMEPDEQCIGYVGESDRSMAPLIRPGSIVVIDTTRRSPEVGAWETELDRPIYFVEHSQGYSVGWLDVQDRVAILQFHPSSGVPARLFQLPAELRVIGQVTAVAANLNPPRRKRQIRS